MKLKIAEFKVKYWRDVVKEAGEVMKSVASGKGVVPQGKEEIFIDAEAVRYIFTDKRLELLMLIKTKKPRSIRELAHMAGRDYHMVHNDVELLKDYGLIKITEGKKGESNRPEVSADEVVIRLPLVG